MPTGRLCSVRAGRTRREPAQGDTRRKRRPGTPTSWPELVRPHQALAYLTPARTGRPSSSICSTTPASADYVAFHEPAIPGCCASHDDTLVSGRRAREAGMKPKCRTTWTRAVRRVAAPRRSARQGVPPRVDRPGSASRFRPICRRCPLRCAPRRARRQRAARGGRP